MKKIWAVLIAIGGILGAIFFFLAGKRSGDKKVFKEDLKDNKNKIKEVKEEVTKVEAKKEVTKKNIASKKKDIKKTKTQLKKSNNSGTKEIISDFKKKYKKN